VLQPTAPQTSIHVYEVRPRSDKRGVDLISDALPFGRLWYTKPDDAVDYAKFFNRSHNALIRVYDSAGNVIETRSSFRSRRSAKKRTHTLNRESVFE
jgi:hypothetical protein